MWKGSIYVCTSADVSMLREIGVEGGEVIRRDWPRGLFFGVYDCTLSDEAYEKLQEYKTWWAWSLEGSLIDNTFARMEFSYYPNIKGA